MGAWGVQLYSSDTAADVKGDYIDQLKRGKGNEEITEEIIRKQIGDLDDPEEEAEVWFALADTQWKYGRLLPYVKENALKYLEREEHLERWKEAGEEKYKARLKVLEDLKAELQSPMPPEKKVSKYRLYKCEWKIGDVFAYKFSSDFSQEKGFKDKYIVLKKIGEDTWWPGHIVPSVYLFKWIGDELPDMSFVEKLTLLPHSQSPERYKNLKEDPILYRIDLLSTSKRVIPVNNLFYLGNSQIDYTKLKNISSSYNVFKWKDFEEYAIKNYLIWKDIDI